MARQSGNTTMQAAATALGNGDYLKMAGFTSAMVQVTGTFSGVVTFEVTIDGVNWFSAACLDVSDTNRTHKTTTNDPGLFHFDEYAGALYIRGRISTYTSGAITVTGVASEQ